MLIEFAGVHRPRPREEASVTRHAGRHSWHPLHRSRSLYERADWRTYPRMNHRCMNWIELCQSISACTAYMYFFLSGDVHRQDRHILYICRNLENDNDVHIFDLCTHARPLTKTSRHSAACHARADQVPASVPVLRLLKGPSTAHAKLCLSYRLLKESTLVHTPVFQEVGYGYM